mgnify:FL=1
MIPLRSILLASCLLLLGTGIVSDPVSFSRSSSDYNVEGRECHAAPTEVATDQNGSQGGIARVSRPASDRRARLSGVGQVLLVGVGVGYGLRQLLGNDEEPFFRVGC